MIDSPTIQQCCDRHKDACDALARLENAAVFVDADRHWRALLRDGNGVYSKLEQGVKLVDTVQSWFGNIKNTRRTDPLLNYMHQARNSEEHTIQDITQRVKAGDATITFKEPFDPKKLEGLQIKIDADQYGNVKVESSDEEIVSTKMYNIPSLVLLRVLNRGVFFDPPTKHLGIDIADQSPIGIGKLFVDYLGSLINDAKLKGI